MKGFAGTALLLTLLVGIGFQTRDPHQPTDPLLPSDIIKGRVSAVEPDEGLVILSVGDQGRLMADLDHADFSAREKQGDRMVTPLVFERGGILVDA